MGTENVRRSGAGALERAKPVQQHSITRGTPVAKPELGTKRIDPETGRNFYDLNKDPIVSPYTGKSYPRSYFDSGDVSVVEDEEEEKELDGEEEAVEVVSLEEADEEAEGGKDDADVDLGDDDDDDVDLGDDDDDETFLEEEEDDDDVADIIDVDDDDDEH